MNFFFIDAIMKFPLILPEQDAQQSHAHNCAQSYDHPLSLLKNKAQKQIHNDSACFNLNPVQINNLAMKSNDRKPCRHLRWWGKLPSSALDSKTLQAMCLWTSSSTVLLAQPSTLSACSQRSVPNYKFSHLFFLRSMTCSMSIEQKMCEKKIFQLQPPSWQYPRLWCIVENLAVSFLKLAFLCGSKWTDTGALILMCCVPYRYSPLTCSTGNILLAKFKSLHDLQISSALEHLELGQDPGAQTCPNVQHDVLAWRVGRDYSYSNCLFFPELPKIQRNCGSSERHFLVRDISNTHPPDC